MSAPPAVLASRRTLIRPLLDIDIDFAYQLYVDPEVGGRLGRWNGGVASREQIVGDLWSQVLAHYVVVGRDTGRRLGITTISTADFRNGYCYLSVMADRSCRNGGLAIEGAALTIQHAFRSWPFRKIYCEMVAENVRQVRRIDRYFELEARYSEHVYRSGAYMDVLVFSLRRESWERRIAPSISRLFTSGQPASSVID